MIYRSTFKGAEDENHVIKTYKRRWTSENDMTKKMINWYKVWCLQKMINCEKNKSFKQSAVTKWRKIRHLN